jgi:hypothetical protein
MLALFLGSLVRRWLLATLLLPLIAFALFKLGSIYSAETAVHPPECPGCCCRYRGHPPPQQRRPRTRVGPPISTAGH